MIDWDLIGLNEHKCVRPKENFIEELVNNTNHDLEEYTTGFDVKINLDFCRETVTVTKRITGEKITIPALMEIQAGKDMINNSLVRLFRYSSEYEFEAGDYVTYTPNNKSCGERTYIIVSNPEPHIRYCSAYVFECTHFYNTYDKKGNIVKVWFYNDDNKIIMRDTNVKVTRNEDIGTTMITLPDNETNRMLGAEQKRILVGGNAFKIIGVNFLNGVNGVLVVMVQIDALMDKDDVENSLAYNEKISSILDKIEQPKLEEITITGENSTCLGYTETYLVNSKSENISWSVNSGYITLNQNGNECDLYVQKRKQLIDKTIVLTVTIDGIDYIKEIKIEG